MNKITIPLIVIVAIIVVLFIWYMLVYGIWGDLNNLRIGKELHLKVDANEIVDYKAIKSFELWDKREREKLQNI